MADVKCGLRDINKNNRANPTRGPGPKMSRDRTEAMLDQRGSGPGRGPVLTLQEFSVATVDCECLYINHCDH